MSGPPDVILKRECEIMGHSVFGYSFCVLALSFTLCLTTVSAKPVDSSPETSTSSARVPCGIFFCNPRTEYCDRGTQRCESCSGKCAGVLDQFMQQECNRECKVYLARQSKEKGTIQSSHNHNHGPDYDVLSQLKSLITDLRTRKAAGDDSSDHVSKTLLIGIAILLITIVILLLAIAIVIVKVYKTDKTCNLKNERGIVTAQEMVPNIKENEETSKLTVNALPPRNGETRIETDSASSENSLHEGEIEAGKVGNELNRNLDPHRYSYERVINMKDQSVSEPCISGTHTLPKTYCKTSEKYLPSNADGEDVSLMTGDGKPSKLVVILDAPRNDEAGEKNDASPPDERFHAGEMEAGMVGNQLEKNMQPHKYSFKKTRDQELTQCKQSMTKSGLLSIENDVAM